MQYSFHSYCVWWVCGYAVALEATLYVSKNSKSSNSLIKLACLFSVSFFLVATFAWLMFFDSVTCLRRTSSFEPQRIEVRCEKWCCRDTSWWVEIEGERERRKCCCAWHVRALFKFYLWILLLLFRLFIRFWYKNSIVIPLESSWKWLNENEEKAKQ